MGLIAKARAWFARKPVLAELTDAQIVTALAAYSLADVDALESRLLSSPQVEVRMEHHFSDGVYAREAVLPANAFFIGHKHNSDHLNFILSGVGKVLVNGRIRTIKGPCIIPADAGTRKAVYVVEEMRWVNIHANPSNETDEKKLEKLYIQKSAAFQSHENDLEEMNHPTLKFQEAV